MKHDTVNVHSKGKNYTQKTREIKNDSTIKIANTTSNYLLIRDEQC